MQRIVRSQLRLFLTGLLAILPLFITVVVVIWAGKLLQEFLGRESFVGKVLASIGLSFVSNPTVAYLFGVIIILLSIYAFGVLVQSKLDSFFLPLVDRMVRRLPLIGSVYDMTDRFVGIFDHKDQSDLKSMSPVWCFFGGEGGTAVLALMPNPEPVILNGHNYHAVLVPTAPVPIGGGLLYVPADWVQPAEFGVEALTSIYVTMGAATPPEKPKETPVDSEVDELKSDSSSENKSEGS